VTFPAVAAQESTVQVQTDVANESDQRRICTIVQELIDSDGTSPRRIPPALRCPLEPRMRRRRP